LTREWFFASLIDFTKPMSTSLYLTFVLPGSSPSALMKVIVMVGPFSSTDFTTSPTPISAAISGITQTREGSQPRFVTISGSGTGGSSRGAPPGGVGS
jgi:hypothetical protein